MDGTKKYKNRKVNKMRHKFYWMVQKDYDEESSCDMY